MERNGNMLIAHTPDRDYSVYTTGKAMEDLNIPVQTAFLSGAWDAPVGFSTG